MKDIYEGHQLCGNLVYGTRCFRAIRYDQGNWKEMTHEHVPAHRIASDRVLEVLRSLVARYSDWPGEWIVGSHLNKRGREPACYPGFTHHTSYPEPGAMRQYVSGPAVNAWCDFVASRTAFRTLEAKEVKPSVKRVKKRR
jgi:hypothetical protein